MHGTHFLPFTKFLLLCTVRIFYRLRIFHQLQLYYVAVNNNKTSKPCFIFCINSLKLP